MKVIELHRSIYERLHEYSIPDGKEESFVIIGNLLNLKKVDVYLNSEQEVFPEVVAIVEQWLEKRKKRIPLAYIIGEQYFWAKNFAVSPAVLIPRPETELLVEKVIVKAGELSKKLSHLTILDLGTGSGAIAVTLALEVPNASVIAVDRSLPALKIAMKNASKFEAERVNMIASDWSSSLKHRSFDIIVSNPPYVSHKALQGLQPELAYEPVVSLDGGKNGMEEIEKIFSDLHHYFKPEGWLFMEIGFDQESFVMELAQSSGHYDQLFVYKDYAGLPRILQARCRV